MGQSNCPARGKQMKQTLILLKQVFESSSSETPRFAAFYRTFKKEFTHLLGPHTKRLKIHKGHFYLSGFMETKQDKIWYFSLGDMRHNYKYTFLIRTAKSFDDYTGGKNHFLSFNSNFNSTIINFLELTRSRHLRPKGILK